MSREKGIKGISRTTFLVQFPPISSLGRCELQKLVKRHVDGKCCLPGGVGENKPHMCYQHRKAALCPSFDGDSHHAKNNFQACMSSFFATSLGSWKPGQRFATSVVQDSSVATWLLTMDKHSNICRSNSFR